MQENMSEDLPHTSLRAILFDYGMVLSGPPNETAWLRLRTLLALDDELFQRCYWSHRHAYDAGALSGEAYWRLIADEAGNGSLSRAEIDCLIEADVDLWTDLNRPMIDWVQRLQRAGIATGVLSNIGDEMERGILHKHPWLAEFQHLTWSHRLKTAKPDSAIYEHAAKGLGVLPPQILFIDDKLENIEAALRCGLLAIQYSSWNALVATLTGAGFGALLETPPRLP